MADWIKQPFTFTDLQRIMSKLIGSVDLFSRLTQTELVRLLESAEKCTFAAGDTILREGGTGDFLYVMIEGAVSVRKSSGTEFTELARLTPGASFGEMSLVDHEARSASVIALEKCVLLRIGEASCWREPVIAAKLFRNIARVVSRRLREMDEAFLWGKRSLPASAQVTGDPLSTTATLGASAQNNS